MKTFQATRTVARTMALALSAIAPADRAFGQDWDVVPDFRNDEAALEISGAVCAGDAGGHDWCVAVNDEKKYVQFFRIDDRAIVPGERGRLLERQATDGTRWGEPDMEAVAYEDGFVYVTGSHGASRQQGEVQPSRFLVFRLPVDAQSGEPLFEITRDGVAPGIERTDRLRDLIRTAGVLSDFAEKPPGENGANIEGLGVLDGRMFFGFRAPSDAAGAVVLEVLADALFGTAQAVPVVHRLQLGTGYGIRDMARLRSGFLVLAGAAGEEDLAPTIWRWTPGTDAVLLHVPRVPAGRKAEGLLLLDPHGAGRTTAVLLFDGEKNGDPMEVTLSATPG